MFIIYNMFEIKLKEYSNMLLDLSDEEYAMVMKSRKQHCDENRPEKTYEQACKYLGFDSDGAYCKKGCGMGYNDCWARRGYECPEYRSR